MSLTEIYWIEERDYWTKDPELKPRLSEPTQIGDSIKSPNEEESKLIDIIEQNSPRGANAFDRTGDYKQPKVEVRYFFVVEFDRE